MGKTSSSAKYKYNKGAYRRYEIAVGVDKKLNYYLEDYKEKGGNIADLIKTTLATHFNIEPDEDFFPFKYDKDGNLIKTEELENSQNL